MSKKKNHNRKTSGPTIRKELRAEAFAEDQVETKSWIKKFSWPIVLVLCVITFFSLIHGSNYERRKGYLTFDESIYMRLGFALKQGDPYNTVKIYEEKKKVRQLPIYLSRPVFKHPPMFPWTISMFYAGLEQKSSYQYEELYAAASKVSNLAGILLILLVFMFAKKYYGYSTGFLAAALMAIDLNMTLSSQKVWMESTLTLWMLTTLILLYKACEEHRAYFYAAGVTFGCAMLTKYTAFIIAPILITYLLVYHREFFKRKEIYIFFAITGLMFTPWLIHNVKVYGGGALGTMIFGQTAGPAKITRFIIVAIMCLAGFAAATFISKQMKSAPKNTDKSDELQSTIWPMVGVVAIGCFIAFMFLQKPFLASILNSLSWSSIPNAGWDMQIFKKEPWYFYLKQHIEYSPFYLFLFLGFLRAPFGQKQDMFLLISCFWILLFTIAWGNYQGRYALSFVPPAILLIASTITVIFKMLSRQKTSTGYIGLGVAGVAMFYFAIKALKVYNAIALNDNVAYF